MAITYGTVAQFSTTSTKYWCAQLDATHFVLCYQDGSVGKAVVCSISGTTITIGTPSTFDSNAANDYMAVTGLDATHFVIVYRNSVSGLIDAICGVSSGTTISSFGTTVAFSVSGGSSSRSMICKLDSTHFVVSYRDSILGKAYVQCGSVSGSTITSGTQLEFGSSTVATGSPMPLCFIDSTHFACAYHQDASTTNTLFICSVSGTTITAGSTSNYTTTIGTVQQALFSLDTTHVGIAYKDNSNSHGSVVIAVISGTTISSFGTPVDFDTTGTNQVSAYTVDATHFIVSYSDNTSGTAHAAAILGTVAGTVPSFGTAVEYDTGDTISNGNISGATGLMDSTHFVTAWTQSASGNSKVVIGTFSTAGAANGNLLAFM